MNGELQVFESPMFQAVTALKIRALDVDGEPWFIARDVCACLDLDNVNMALLGLDEDEKATPLKLDCSRKISGLRKDTLLISEPGLYSLIMRSNKPEAKSFKDWICKDVLPSIRKHGMYVAPALFDNPDSLIASLEALKVERATRLAREILNSDYPANTVIDVPFNRLN